MFLSHLEYTDQLIKLASSGIISIREAREALGIDESDNLKTAIELIEEASHCEPLLGSGLAPEAGGTSPVAAPVTAEESDY